MQKSCSTEHKLLEGRCSEVVSEVEIRLVVPMLPTRSVLVDVGGHRVRGQK